MAFGSFLPTTSSRFAIESLKSLNHKKSEKREPVQQDPSRQWRSNFLPDTLFGMTINDTSRSYHPGWILAYVRF